MLFTLFAALATLSALTTTSASPTPFTRQVQCAKPTINVPTGPVYTPYTFTGTTQYPCTFVVLYLNGDEVAYIGSMGGHNVGDVQMWQWADDLGYRGPVTVQVAASEMPGMEATVSDMITIQVNLDS